MRVVATAGHVDHGKSSLIRALTGTDPDRLTEERQRGLTIDLGFAHTTLPSGAGVSFVDVPGHTRFLANMLAGIGAVDACMFIVAANEGWMPQSEEHLRIIDVLGIGGGFIALTKRDLVDDDLAEIAKLEIQDRVTGSVLDGAPIVPVAATSGNGLQAIGEALDNLVAVTPAAADRQRPRLWVDRSFAATGSGTVVTGTLADGTLHSGDAIVVAPTERTARIRAIQTLGQTVDQIGPGNRVALNLNGVGYDEISRGDAIITPDRWHRTTTVDASLTVLASLHHTVSRRGAYLAYIGARELPVRLRVLGTEALAPGEVGAIRLHFAVAGSGIPLLPGDRYVLRESGRDETVGGGEILDVDPRLKASRARPDRSIERVVSERGWVTVDKLHLLTGEQVEPTVGRWVATTAERQAAERRLRAAIEAADELGLEVATLAAHERALLEALDDIVVDGSRARRGDAVDPLANHPLITEVLAGGFSPTAPTDRAVVRELVGRGILVERDGVVFHADVIEAAAELAAQLLAAAPDGFTVSEFRDAAATSRKYALALVAELDGRGITRRRDDYRVAGPRLPSV